MARIITSATAYLRPVQVERSPGHPTIVRYSTAMEPSTVLRQAMGDLDNDEAIALARILGMVGSAASSPLPRQAEGPRP
jgi:hypothetical protein